MTRTRQGSSHWSCDSPTLIGIRDRTVLRRLSRKKKHSLSYVGSRFRALVFPMALTFGCVCTLLAAVAFPYIFH